MFHLPVLNARFSIPDFPFSFPGWFRLAELGLRLASFPIFQKRRDVTDEHVGLLEGYQVAALWDHFESGAGDEFMQTLAHA